mgnify:CR=1 FL=1
MEIVDIKKRPSPGQHVGQQLEAELDVVELLLEAAESLLDHVLTTVHIGHYLIHRVLSLKWSVNKNKTKYFRLRQHVESCIL